jgi:transcriptional regulator with XRE-family HTH domain
MSNKKLKIRNFIERLERTVDEKMNGNWAELSRKCGISTPTLSKIKGGTEPGIEKVIKIANALDVSIEWLTRGEGEKPISEKTRQLDNLMRALTTEQQDEILRFAEEKKRLNEMTELINHIKNQNNTISL